MPKTMSTLMAVQQISKMIIALKLLAKQLRVSLTIWLLFSLVVTAAGYLVLSNPENSDLGNWVSLAVIVALPVFYCIASYAGSSSLSPPVNYGRIPDSYSDRLRRHWHIVDPPIVALGEARIASIIIMSHPDQDHLAGFSDQQFQTIPEEVPVIRRFGSMAYLELLLLDIEGRNPFVTVTDSETLKTGTSNTTVLLQ